MNRLFDDVFIVKSIAADRVNILGEKDQIMTIDLSAADFMCRLGRHYGIKIGIGAQWFAQDLKIRKNVPVCLCSKMNVLFFTVKCSETKMPIWFRYTPLLRYKSSPNEENSIYIGKHKMIKATFSRYQFKNQIKRIEKFKHKISACASCKNIKCINCN